MDPQSEPGEDKLQPPAHPPPPEVQRHATGPQQLHHPAGAAQPPSNAPQSKESETYQGLDLGSGYKQCSVSRAAANTMNVTEIKNGVCVTAATGAPKIGGLDWPGDESVLKTFHGARVAKNGRTVNESISCSYDPRNLTCLGCPDPHHILNTGKPAVLIFADQNFVPFLSGGSDNCIAVCRSENASLSELAELSIEILEKNALQQGTTIIYGSGSHLFKVGTSQYATDWILLTNRCAQKWPGVNICPLIPIIRSNCPGSIARDISTLASWLGRVYANSTTGLLDTWKYMLQIADAACTGNTIPEICKIPLPTSASIGSVQPHTFVYNSACPDTLHGMDRKATLIALKTLIITLNRDFGTNLDAEKILTGSWANKPDSLQEDDSEMDHAPENSKHIVLIGASNMKRLIPVLNASGYTVSDLTRASWIATPENISHILECITSLNLDPGYTMVMELFGNSTYRYEQFDGTKAMPFKAGNGYHLEGRISVCDEDSFLRMLANVEPIITAGKPDIKLFIPPLPRHIFTGCCNMKTHSTNVRDPNYKEELLGKTIGFRSVLKTHC
jgi:hypothetical protein